MTDPPSMRKNLHARGWDKVRGFCLSISFQGKDLKPSTLCCAGAFDSFLNIQITLVLLAQLTICLAFAVGSYAWRQTKGYDNYYLQFDQYSNGNYQSGIVYVIILFITFWILFSYLVPISLFVTIEIIKFVLVSHSYRAALTSPIAVLLDAAALCACFQPLQDTSEVLQASLLLRANLCCAWHRHLAVAACLPGTSQ